MSTRRQRERLRRMEFDRRVEESRKAVEVVEPPKKRGRPKKKVE